jgi:hypothetical protein
MIAVCWSAISPSAPATPGADRTSGSRSALIGGSDPSICSTTSCAVTTASVPSFDSVKMSSNAFSIVSVRT